MKKYRNAIVRLVFLVLLLSACASQTPVSPQVPGSAISVEVTKDNCPSIEAKADMQITWTNNDTVDLILLIERKDENGATTEAGGTDLLQPGTTFSVSSLAPGEYTYYCTKGQNVFGTITIIE